MDEIIDYGKWVVPKSWDEVTLKQFQEIERYYADKDKQFDVREVLHIFTDRTIDEINALPMDFVETIMDYLMFIQTGIEEKPASNKVFVNGEWYTVHTENKLRVGEYVAVDTAMKGDEHNYAAILAILCRKEGEIYDSHYENEVLEERIKMWERVPVVEVLPIVSFFLQSWLVLQTPSLLSSRVEELISHIRKDIENSAANGEISKHSMKSVMKKLKKLEKSISTI